MLCASVSLSQACSIQDETARRSRFQQARQGRMIPGLQMFGSALLDEEGGETRASLDPKSAHEDLALERSKCVDLGCTEPVGSHTCNCNFILDFESQSMLCEHPSMLEHIPFSSRATAGRESLLELPLQQSMERIHNPEMSVDAACEPKSEAKLTGGWRFMPVVGFHSECALRVESEFLPLFPDRRSLICRGQGPAA